jgi:hypothetical protein
MIFERSLLMCPITHRSDETYPNPDAELRAVLDKQAMARWTLLMMHLISWRKDYRDVQVYQDGIPFDTTSDEIRTTIYEARFDGTPNAETLRYLAERGAILMPTEDPKLLEESEDLSLKSEKVTDLTEKIRALLDHNQRMPGLVTRRDIAIARTINKTLKNEGMLMIGADHAVGEYLASDIRVTVPRYLFDVLPAKSRPNYRFEQV